MRKLILILCIISAWNSVSGSGSDIYQAYVTNSMGLWKDAMIRMEKDYLASGNPSLLRSLTDSQYGYIGYCISAGDRIEAREWLRKAAANLETLLRIDPDDPTLYSLKGALSGYTVILEPVKAPLMARKSAEANQKAMQLGPYEPRVWMEKANIEFYKPAILGGSAADAVPLYEKAVRLFEAQPERIEQNWLYLNCLANLGRAYEADGQINKAGEVYRKLLKLEPALSWVRDDVYPDQTEKHPHL